MFYYNQKRPFLITKEDPGRLLETAIKNLDMTHNKRPNNKATYTNEDILLVVFNIMKSNRVSPRTEYFLSKTEYQ